MVELIEPPTATIFAEALSGSHHSGTKARATSTAQSHLSVIVGRQLDLVAKLESGNIGATVLYRVQRVFNGIAIRVEQGALNEIVALSGVKAVHRMSDVRPANNQSVPFLGTPKAWTNPPGVTGEGVSIGVIDSGIDYIHRDLFGSGSADDYAANDPSTIDDGFFPTSKVVGGWDFADDDPDPTEVPGRGSFGHGTHVSGTAAGVGVNSDFTSYTGVYDESTPFDELVPGPGVAPDADLYALRVFGPEIPSGNGDRIVAAIEWAADPNGDGDFSDHLDVINMSLGGPYGSASSVFSTSCDNAAMVGVIPVAAAGNSGEGFYLMSDPGSSTRTIGVAATHHGEQKVFGPVRVNTPAPLAGDLYAEYQIFGTFPSTSGLTADVAIPEPVSACNPLTNSADVAGRIVLLDWLDCSIDTKAAFAEAAGAVGAIVTPTSWPFLPLTYRVSGSVGIPVAMIPAADGEALRASVPAANVTLIIKPMDFDIADSATEYSSRGPRVPDSLLKPDVAAPGGVFSARSNAAVGSPQAVLFNGTSMATPHVAGAMALLRQLHPDWTVEELKALLMNSAVDVFSGPEQSEPYESLNRVGAGRIDLERAVRTEAIVLPSEPEGLVSASFGLIDVEGTANRTRTVEITNRGDQMLVFELSLDTRSDLPGAAFALPSETRVEIAAGETESLEIGLMATAVDLRDICDPGAPRYVPVKAAFGPRLPTAATVLPGSCLNEEAAYLILTPQPPRDDHPTLRLPVHAVLRPVSAMAATEDRLMVTENLAQIDLHLAGSDLDSGSEPPGIRSLVSAFELAEISPENPAIAEEDRLYDLGPIGVTSDYRARVAAGQGLEETVVSFALVSRAPWVHGAVLATEIWIDREGDGVYDAILSRFPAIHWDTSITWSWPYWGDVYWTFLEDLHTGEIRWQFAVNSMPGTDIQADLLNTDAMILSVRASDLGLVEDDSNLSFFVRTSVSLTDWYMDTSGKHSFDPARPGLHLTGTEFLPMFWDDLNDSVVEITADRRALVANQLQGLLLIHHHNAGGQRAQIIEVIPAEEAPRDASGRVVP